MFKFKHLLPISQIKHLDRLRPSTHRMGIVRQGDDRILVTGQLGDEAHLNALRLQGGNKGMPRAVGGHGGEANRHASAAVDQMRRLEQRTTPSLKGLR